MSWQGQNTDDIEGYFTDVEYLRELFKKLLLKIRLKRQLLVIHGVGGVGKTTLLRMYRLNCKTVGTPVGLASAVEEKSVMDFLTRWNKDFEADGIRLKEFSRLLSQYRAILAKVDRQADIEASKAGNVVKSAASKTAESASGAAVGAAIGSVIPGIGTTVGAVIGGAIGGTGAEVVVDWLRGFLSKSEIDLLLDPAEVLTDVFFRDVAQIAVKRRLVLMLDTYEQVTGLDDWVRSVARRLPSNILLVISGREIPGWGSSWPEWYSKARLEKLEPMTEDHMRELVHNYFQFSYPEFDELDPKQVEKIISFGRGLPMVVNSAVRLWAEYEFEDFDDVKPMVGSDLVDRLSEGVPKELHLALEAAATLRWFNRDLLAMVLELEDADSIYKELRRFPFVMPHTRGRAIHDVVREIMDENLQLQSPQTHRRLHERAAGHFANDSYSIVRKEPEKANREWLYHLFRADEEKGVIALRTLTEETGSHLFVGQLRTIMSDVNTYPLREEKAILWRKYCNARLTMNELKFAEAEEIFLQIATDEKAESMLRAYAYTDLGRIWSGTSRLSQPGGVERALRAVELSRRYAPELNSKLALNYSYLRSIYIYTGQPEKAMDAVRQQYAFNVECEDRRGTVDALDRLKKLCGTLGLWKEAFAAEEEGLSILDSSTPNVFLRNRLIGFSVKHKIWSGWYSGAEDATRQALEFAKQYKYIDAFPGLMKDLGLILGLQKRWDKASVYFSESAEIYRNRERDKSAEIYTLGYWGRILFRNHQFTQAEEYLRNNLDSKRAVGDPVRIPEVLVWLGELYEAKERGGLVPAPSEDFLTAEAYFREALEYRWTGQHYFECAALTGLLRIEFARNGIATVADIYSEAEQIALEHGYHDYLALLHLYKAHIQWSSHDEFWPGGFIAALESYKHSLLYALTFNRFLLDEVLWGDNIAVPYLTIVAQCHSRGFEGRQMLEALAEWWKGSTYETPPSGYSNRSRLFDKTFSLTKMEQLARVREPGDGSQQSDVISTLNRNLN